MCHVSLKIPEVCRSRRHQCKSEECANVNPKLQPVDKQAHRSNANLSTDEGCRSSIHGSEQRTKGIDYTYYENLRANLSSEQGQRTALCDGRRVQIYKNTSEQRTKGIDYTYLESLCANLSQKPSQGREPIVAPGGDPLGDNGLSA
jgi:hypothetical protein